MKSFLKLIPILFGAGIIVGIINMLGLLFIRVEYLPEIILKATQIGGLTAAALLPVGGYLLFLVYYFILDLAASVVSIPQKLDGLKETKAP